MISFGNLIAGDTEPVVGGQSNDTTTGVGGPVTEGAVLSTGVSSPITEVAILSTSVSGLVIGDTALTKIVSSPVA